MLQGFPDFYALVGLEETNQGVLGKSVDERYTQVRAVLASMLFTTTLLQALCLLQ